MESIDLANEPLILVSYGLDCTGYDISYYPDTPRYVKVIKRYVALAA